MCEKYHSFLILKQRHLRLHALIAKYLSAKNHIQDQLICRNNNYYHSHYSHNLATN